MELLLIVFAAIAAVVGFFYREATKKLKPAQLELLANLARVAVSAAETVGFDQKLSSDDKYKLASDGLVELAQRIGIELSETEVAVLVHAVLREIQVP